MRDGSQATFARGEFERIAGVHATVRDPKHRFIALTYPDGGGGDVYIDNADEISGFTINRPGGTGLFDDLFQLMSCVGAVLYWADLPPCLAVVETDAVTHLPADMLAAIGPARVVSSGAEIIAAIRKR